MNAYLFTAAVTSTRMTKAVGRDALGGDVGRVNQVQQWNNCVNQIIVAPTLDEAEKALVDWLNSAQDETPVTREVNQMIVSQLIDRLFGETLDRPLDWPAICRQFEASLEAQTDYFEQGNWVDPNTVLASGSLGCD